MKNIHVLPTENSSRLSYNKDGVLELHRLQWRKNTQNIYITSDEEIKEGDWCLSKLNEVILFRSYNEKFYKKIILTTDQDLIKDGVQPIDDEFLEWFVKNPSCEYVNIEKYHGINTSIAEVNYISGDGSLSWQGRSDLRDYKIIIPKEEPKPIHEQIIEHCGGEEKFKEIAGLKPKQEHNKYLSCCRSKEECHCGKNIKQETLEEAYLSSIKNVLYFNNDAQAIRLMEKYFHIKEEEQDKNKYSEVFEWLANKDYLSDKVELIQKEFEEFKKK
jgi:hypothetical protein